MSKQIYTEEVEFDGTIHETKQELSVWQHYVPRMYLRNFGRVLKNKKSKEIALVSFYQFDTERMVEEVSVESICAVDYFYDNDNHIEHKLSDKERVWADSIKKIVKCDDNELLSLPDEDIENVREFAVYQYCRTLGAFKHVKTMNREIMQTLFDEEYPQYKEERYKALIEDTIQKKVDEDFQKAGVLVKKADDLLKEAKDLKFIVIKNTSNLPFITSDVPAILMNPFDYKKGPGMAQIGIVLMIPISEWHLVVIYDEKMYTYMPEVIDNPEEIDLINRYEVISADERIVARNQGSLIRYADDKDLLRNRQKIREKSVTTNSSSENKESKLIAISNRRIPYDIPLRMFTLPKAYRKIPVEARDTFPRKYDKKYRDSILLRATSIRELYKNVLGNKTTKYEAKRIQKGYVALLDLFDDYWEVPIEDRVKPNQVRKHPRFNAYSLYKADDERL